MHSSPLLVARASITRASLAGSDPDGLGAFSRAARLSSRLCRTAWPPRPRTTRCAMRARGLTQSAARMPPKLRNVSLRTDTRGRSKRRANRGLRDPPPTTGISQVTSSDASGRKRPKRLWFGLAVEARATGLAPQEWSNSTAHRPARRLPREPCAIALAVRAPFSTPFRRAGTKANSECPEPHRAGLRAAVLSSSHLQATHPWRSRVWPRQAPDRTPGVRKAVKDFKSLASRRLVRGTHGGRRAAPSSERCAQAAGNGLSPLTMDADPAAPGSVSGPALLPFSMSSCTLCPPFRPISS